ncbi:MAG: archaellin/type IV pilin N-terminal domain-containing protein [Ignisphaera sp.]
MRSLYRGIEPIIAVVILVAVTLVLAIGVIGWIMGWWGTLGGTETLQIMPYSTLGRNSMLINITNAGSLTSYIVKAEIVGLGSCTVKNCSKAGTDCKEDSVAKIEAGAECKVGFDCSGVTTSPGTRYTIRVYTKAGNVYSIVLEAK